LSVKIYYDQIKYRIRKTGEIKRFLEKVVRDEKKIPGDLVFILTNDEEMLKINSKFLKKEYFTDVISFNYSEEEEIRGEIYMSVETIRENSVRYRSGMNEELLRVMIHGVLHLCGYNDLKKDDRKKMFARQEEKVKEFENRSE
jgi:probable rRNA maturation factor